MSPQRGALPHVDPGEGVELAEPITDQEAEAIGDLGNEPDDCGLLSQARLAHRELHLDLVATALRQWEQRNRGDPME